MPMLAQAPARPAQGQKLFYRINEVAKMTGLKPYVLRYWEGEFPELAPPKDASDQRRYRKSDIDVVLTIRKLLYEDRYTIEGARKRLREELRARGAAQVKAVKPAATVVPVKRPAVPVLALTDDSARRLDRSLKLLRSEVRELLNLLGA
jgi:DNA-binding transcriptional MerR regulator